MCVLTVQFQQAFVVSLFHDCTIVEDDNIIGGTHCRESMRDQNRHLVMALRAKMIEYRGL